MRRVLQLFTAAFVLLFSGVVYASSSEVWRSPTCNFKNITSVQFDKVSLVGSQVADVPGYDKACEFMALQEGRRRARKLSFLKDGADVRIAIEVNTYDIRYQWYEPRVWTEEKKTYDYENVKRPNSIITDRRTITRTRTVVHEQPGAYGWSYAVGVFITVYDNRTNQPIFRFSKREDSPDTRSEGYYEIIKTFWKKFSGD